MKQKEKLTEAVRLEKSVVDRARKYVEGTRQTLGGFISAELKAVLDQVAPLKSNKKAV